MNALCLAPALRFNEPVVPEAIAALATALGTDDAAARVEELARLGGFERLRDFGDAGGRARRGRGGDGAAARRAREPATRDADGHRGAAPLDLVSR